MAVRGTGGGLPPPPNQAQGQANEQQQGAQQELRARNAAGKQAHSSPKSEYQRPHRVHTSAERRAAEARKHEASLQDEAMRHLQVDADNKQIQRGAEIEEQQRLTGVNLDERRNKRGRKQDDEDTPEQESAEEQAAKSLGLTDGAGKYFQDMPVDRLGDMALTNPNEMKRLLGPSVRFAQHAMLLAEARLKEGAPREDALRYLASIYLGVADRAYANKALREFGASTGIVDLYPLEVMRHLLEHVPSFLSRVSTASFLSATPAGGYKAKAGVPLKLAFEATLRIRGFAIKGGEKPGYLLEPLDPAGTYHLTFGSPGAFTVMMSALDKIGTLHLQEFRVDVAPGDVAALDTAAAMKRERSADGSETAEGEPPPDATAGAAPSGAAIPPAKTDAAAKKKDLTFTIPRKI
jgi:hypothetical protein